MVNPIYSPITMKQFRAASLIWSTVGEPLPSSGWKYSPTNLYEESSGERENDSESIRGLAWLLLESHG